MRRPNAVAVLAAVLFTPAIAHAKLSLQSHLTLSGGWTDNVLNLPQAESDFLFEIAPGLLLTAGSPRAVQSLGYDFTADLFVSHSEANSYTHQLTWRGFFL